MKNTKNLTTTIVRVTSENFVDVLWANALFQRGEFDGAERLADGVYEFTSRDAATPFYETLVIGNGYSASNVELS